MGKRASRLLASHAPRARSARSPSGCRPRTASASKWSKAGAGAVGVVLAHESPADLCGWLPYATTLTRAGIRVLAYDRDLRAAAGRLRADGAGTVFLVGASFGGAAALTYAPALDVDGVVSLSGEARLEGAGLDGLSRVQRLRRPLLIVGSRHDRYLPVSDALALLRRAGTKNKRTALYPAGFHGWDIVEDAPYAARARALILHWIRARA